MEDLRPDIASAAARMSTKFGSKREIRKLVEYLWEGEAVHRMTSGLYGNGTGLVVLTDRRLFFVRDGWVNKSSEDFPLERVSSVQWSSSLMLGTITIFASGNKAEIKQVAKADGKEIVDLIRARLSGHASAPNGFGGRQGSFPPPPAHAAQPAGPVSGVDPDVIFRQLKQLGELRDASIVTPQEFEAKKVELLARL